MSDIKDFPNKTPRTLDEAILNAITIGPLSETAERTYHIMRDFISQKFGVAYLSPECLDPKIEALLKSLFEGLTRREK